MKKMTQHIRDAETWREREIIAKDERPGTAFDALFQTANDFVFAHKHGKFGNRDHSLQLLGAWLASVILAGDYNTLKRAATALEQRRWHKASIVTHRLRHIMAG
jgi:hypothetical protein